jgi:hypothetical protein
MAPRIVRQFLEGGDLYAGGINQHIAPDACDRLIFPQLDDTIRASRGRIHHLEDHHHAGHETTGARLLRAGDHSIRVTDFLTDGLHPGVWPLAAAGRAFQAFPDRSVQIVSECVVIDGPTGHRDGAGTLKLVAAILPLGPVKELLLCPGFKGGAAPRLLP